MNKVIIICGHGHYATGLQSSVNLIAGNNEDVYYMDFTENDSDITLKQKLSLIIHKNMESQILFVCDILGGTPFKVAAEMANENDDYQVVCGCNLISIIEAIFNKEEYEIAQLATSIVKSTKETAMVFKKVNITEVNNDVISEEGI
jgi:N-acetylgalactosamine PTS system EIIA component